LGSGECGVLGANVTYGIWLAAAGRNPAALPFALRTIKLIDDRLANPSYGMLLVTGIILLLIPEGYSFSTPWVGLAIGLYIVAVLVGVLGYSPALRRQIALAENPGPGSGDYAAAARRGTLMGILLVGLVVVIELVMVTKPALWGA